MSAARPQALRLAAFAALGCFAALHWATLVDGAPNGRVGVAVLAVTVGGALLLVIDRLRLPRLGAWALAAVAIVAATALALAASGISLRLLWPGGWGELGSNLDQGLAGLAGKVDYPYQGANEWSRLAILAAAPLALGVAAALAFWPARVRRQEGPRLAALLALVALFLAAVAIDPRGGSVLGGVALTVLIAAWLWLPGLRRRDALAAVALVAATAAIAVPAAARLDASDPWLDYTDWTWSAADGVDYRWSHSYGPIDWPREGKTMFEARSDAPLYWKAMVLDRFDGVRWERSDESRASIRALPADVDRVELPALADRSWLQRADIRVGSLESEFVIAAGTPLAVNGLDDVAASADGTATIGDEPLGDGAAYTFAAYVPDPTAAQMRASPGPYPTGLAPYTQVQVPGEPTVANAGPSALRPAESVTVPLRGYEADDSRAERRILASPYADAYRLARRLTRDAPTAYDAVRAVEDHFERGYLYTEDPPTRDLPLASFLFEDRAGYCQQFSGAMALLLRMAGIPARVVGGFAPGTESLEGSGAFEVEDFDAHSWVEVYFNGIGWVTFDPTPAASPAAARAGGALLDADERGRLGASPTQSGSVADVPTGAAAGDAAGGAGGFWLVAGAALLVATLVLFAASAVRAARFRALPESLAAETQLRELPPALERFGVQVPAGTTLLALERKLRTAGRRASAGYVSRLRSGRYAGAPGRPSLGERRALRRELGRSHGLGGRLRALLALPPGGPRRAARSGRSR